MKLLVLAAASALLGGCVASDGVALPVARSTAPIPAAPDRTDRHYRIPFAVAENRPSRINAWFDLNPDCSVAGLVSVRLLSPPSHGTMTLRQGRYYPDYPRGDQRRACNLRPRDGIAGVYRPDPGYVGPDRFVIAVVTPDGSAWTSEFRLAVK